MKTTADTKREIGVVCTGTHRPEGPRCQWREQGEGEWRGAEELAVGQLWVLPSSIPNAPVRNPDLPWSTLFSPVSVTSLQHTNQTLRGCPHHRLVLIHTAVEMN